MGNLVRRAIVVLYVMSLALSLPRVCSAQRLTCCMSQQDQTVFAPANSRTIWGLIQNISWPWQIDSMTIYVDGTAYGATIDQWNHCGSVAWDASSAPNPSEHSIHAIATISSSYPPFLPPQHMNLDSTNKPDATPPGDGRNADFIIANVQPSSLTYNGLAINWDRYTPVEQPEIQWGWGIFDDPEADPCAYKQGGTPSFRIDFDPSNNQSAISWGFTMNFTATPGFVNAGDANPVILYNVANTPEPCTLPILRQCTGQLLNSVNVYDNSLTLTMYVWFKEAKAWGRYPGNSFTSNNTMYATLDIPKSPMDTPWVDVLDDACNWAGGSTDAVTATRMLASSEYSSCQYNGGFEADANTTTWTDGYEAFYLLDWLNGVGMSLPPRTGQCNDFADYLVCLSTAIGSVNLSVQRAATVYNIMHNLSGFDSKAITTSPNGGIGGSVHWHYHQWTSSNVFDGCIRFDGVTTPANLALQAYLDALINWSTAFGIAPQSAFKPTIYNSRTAP